MNSFGGRFPAQEQDQLTRLIVDSPVMVGHRKDKLPIGRTFYATITKRNGEDWVKSYFYWLKSADGAETLRENVDGGIYKECSIGFTFLVPECSICGKDIRLCEHEPLQNYTISGKEESCYYNYRQIERVLETSLVYRGAVTGTAISKELQASCEKQVDSYQRKMPATYLKNLEQLDTSEQYLVSPLYDGLPIQVVCKRGVVSLRQIDGSPISEALTIRFAPIQLVEGCALFGLILGYRGKERCSSQDVINFINAQNSAVSRLELHILDCGHESNVQSSEQPGRFRVRRLRHQVVSYNRLLEAVRRMKTRDGVRIWAQSTPPPEYAGYIYKPTISEILTVDQYGLVTDNEHLYAMLLLRLRTGLKQYKLCQFNLARLYRGMKFISDESDGEATSSTSHSHIGRVMSVDSRNGGMKLSLRGKLNGRFIIRPIKIGGLSRHLFYIETR